MLQGYKTVLVGLGLAVAPVAAEYLGKVDWTQYMSPQAAFFVSGMIMVAMRFFTSTSIFKKE